MNQYGGVDNLNITKEAGRSNGNALPSLAIVGSHPDTRENAPFDNPEYDIWLFNEAPMKPEVYKRWTSVLQIHKENVYSSGTNWVNEDHW